MPLLDLWEDPLPKLPAMRTRSRITSQVKAICYSTTISLSKVVQLPIIQSNYDRLCIKTQTVIMAKKGSFVSSWWSKKVNQKRIDDDEDLGMLEGTLDG